MPRQIMQVSFYEGASIALLPEDSVLFVAEHVNQPGSYVAFVECEVGPLRLPDRRVYRQWRYTDIPPFSEHFCTVFSAQQADWVHFYIEAPRAAS
jgi:hypothetical protein